MVAGQGLRLAASGLLTDVKPTDAVIFLAAAAVLSAVALVACAVPCVRALRMQPAGALRCE
jgi:hypothetical protein